MPVSATSVSVETGSFAWDPESLLAMSRSVVPILAGVSSHIPQQDSTLQERLGPATDLPASKCLTTASLLNNQLGTEVRKLWLNRFESH
jgi:hypothetical protein